ncbi:MAG: metallophosphoesterase, partial [Microcystaceae cyanobacterium]
MFRRSPLAWLSLGSLTWLFSFGLGAIAWAETIPFTLLHFNDVYEIMPIAGGKWGGLARVATLRQRLKQENPHTYTVLAGDLLSPSALGTAQVKGERLAGKQMVAVLNQLGLDYATFGNHEFDLSETEFLQ